MRRTIILTTKRYNSEGKKVGDKKSFSVSHDKVELTEPMQKKYF